MNQRINKSLDVNEERLAVITDILARALSAQEISCTVHDRALMMITKLHVEAPAVPCPHIQCADNEVLFTWENYEHHMEIEISKEDPVVIFYANWQTNKGGSAEATIEDPLPQIALEHLALFVHSDMKRHTMTEIAEHADSKLLAS